MDDNNNYPFILYNVFNFEYVDCQIIIIIYIIVLIWQHQHIILILTT